MRAGDLRDRVVIERPSADADDVVIDARGQDVTPWAPVATVWAEVIDLSGREIDAARQLYATATVRVRTRHLPTATAACRVVHGDRILYVGHVTRDNRRRETILLCDENPAG